MDISNYTLEDFLVKDLGPRRVRSPIKLSKKRGDGIYNYIEDGERILYDASLASIEYYEKTGQMPISFEKAGPKEFIFFEPSKTKVGIVTCGGLCPGLNNVIRGLVMQLWYRYGVRRILGFRYGYEGLVPKYNHPYMELNPQVVERIHNQGGTILGTSRGKQDITEIVDTLEIHNINILFTIGGDGTLRGAHAIHEEIERRKLKIAVVGIPKTIDNDINFIDRSFGFETAFAIADEIVRNAHNEARGAYNGIAIVKLMGRDSGFIAANAALATQEANFVLIPEMYFTIEGLCKALKERLERRHHALIIVGEGAGQYFFKGENVETDPSGNIKYKDIGSFLQSKIHQCLTEKGVRHTIKYIDPSYIIRSAPAIPNDSKFCNLLAQNAVHAAMAGKTDVVVGHWNQSFTLLPIPAAVRERKHINLESELWWNVLETTGQPPQMI